LVPSSSQRAAGPPAEKERARTAALWSFILIATEADGDRTRNHRIDKPGPCL
jgi:hypothetical protein